MTDPIETAVKTDVTSFETRLKAVEAKVEGFVKVHIVYFVGAICLVAGGVSGYLLHR